MVSRRFCGELTIVMPDGYIEKAFVRDRKKSQFLQKLIETKQEIQRQRMKDGCAIIHYKGDLAPLVSQVFEREASNNPMNSPINGRVSEKGIKELLKPHDLDTLDKMKFKKKINKGLKPL